jgi:hypothetical protein
VTAKTYKIYDKDSSMNELYNTINQVKSRKVFFKFARILLRKEDSTSSYEIPKNNEISLVKIRENMQTRSDDEKSISISTLDNPG